MLSISASLLSFYCFCLSECERETNGSVRLLHVKSIYSQQRALRLVHYGYGSKWLCQAERLESGVLVLLHVKYVSIFLSLLQRAASSSYGKSTLLPFSRLHRLLLADRAHPRQGRLFYNK